MKDFFANDGAFMTYLKRIGLAIVFNFVYILTSVPILTIGISNVALFQVMMELVQDRKSESSYLMVYFSAFTDNFVKGLVWGILQVLVTVVAGFDLLFFVANVQKDATPINIASLILTILLIVALVSFFNTLYMTMMHYAGGFKEEFKNTIYIVKNNKKNILFSRIWEAYRADLQYHDPQEGRACTIKTRSYQHVCLRPDGVQLFPYRECASVHRV